MLILFVGIVTVFLLMAAVVVDLSLWLAERRDVQKAADLAAAAGALDLPVSTTSGTPAAMTAACKIAGANGYGSGHVDSQCGTSGSAVKVEMLCTNHLTGPVPATCSNGSSGASTCPLPATNCDGLRVVISGQGPVLFSSVFGITASDATVSSGAAAGLRWGETPLDTIILVDSSGSMAIPGCGTSSTSSCPLLQDAKDAATGFVDMLLNQGGSESQVGYAPYNFCYFPFVNNQCVAGGLVQNLTQISPFVKLRIANTVAWGGTNACIALLKAQELFAAPQAQQDPGVHRSIILLADGDNTFYYGGSTTYPPAACRPPGDAPTPNCSTAQSAERALDLMTYQQAQALVHPTAGQKPADIYVVGFKVCGSDDGKTRATAGYCAGIGDAAHDNFADQRLLKCIASSATNFYRVTNSSDLPSVFQQVAATILGRRLLQ